MSIAPKQQQMAIKRKLIPLTFAKRLEILKKLETLGAAGSIINDKQLVVEYGISESTLAEIKTQREKFFKPNAPGKTGKLHPSALIRQHDQSMLEWFRKRRADNLPLTPSIVMQKARQFHAELKLDQPAVYAEMWLSSFKKRHGLTIPAVATESKSTMTTNDVEMFVDDFAKFVKKENLSLEQIYNADEAALYWNSLPAKPSVAGGGSSLMSDNMEKDRITLMACSNAAGTHKTKLLVIGKSAKPRAFLGAKNLPVIYKYSKQAWVRQDIFTEWFHNDFLPEARAHCRKVGLPDDCKIILLLDKCAAHPAVQKLNSTDKIVPMYLPPKCSSIQPMEKGIIKSLKYHYRSHYLRRLVNSGCDFDEFQKNFNLLNGVWCLADAWANVTRPTLQNAWHDVYPVSILEEEDSNESFFGFLSKSEQERELLMELLAFARRGENSHALHLKEDAVRTWLECDKGVPVEPQFINDDLFKMALNAGSPQVNSSGGEAEVDDQTSGTSFEDGLQFITKTIEFLEEKGVTKQQDIMTFFRVKQEMIEEQKKMRLKHGKLDQLPRNLRSGDSNGPPRGRS